MLQRSLVLMGGALVTPLILNGQTETRVKSTTERPNVILIMADDLGWGDVGFNGNKVIRTPHLDELAASGLIMNNFYSAGPLSSPTRASVLTGRNPYRTGVFSANEGIIRPEEHTLPEMLQADGYATGHFGKWHLGTLTYSEKDANRGRPENRHLYNPPKAHGYDAAFVTESKVPTYDPMVQPIENNYRFWDYIAPNEERRSYHTFYWDIDGKKETENLSGDDSRIIMDRVIPFIDQSVKYEKPFFSVVWFHTPHLPCVAGPEYAAMYSEYNLNERNYYGCITAMDDQVGRLVRYLKDRGVYENTLILFCSDNGPELNTPGTANEMRGKKRSLYEGGIKVPAFAVWPAKIAKEQTTEMRCFTSDYFPTVLESVGLELPDRTLDGVSFKKVLQDPTNTRKEPLIFCSANQGAVIDGDYKLYYCNGAYELYDLVNDPTEEFNLTRRLKKRTKTMKMMLKEAMKSYRDSFEGEEYGTQSYELVKQHWSNIYN